MNDERVTCFWDQRDKPCTSSDTRLFHKKHHALKPDQLKTGFGLHTFSSLEVALLKARKPRHICVCEPCVDEIRDDGALEAEDRDESQSLSKLDQQSFMAEMAQERLKYLMGLPTAAEDHEAATPEIEYIVEEEDLITGSSEATRRAQRYLREHKIFEFFQFLITHLLADIPFDPINYLISLLDKCLIYRAGICDPPLLYQKPHIECLFNLMDRMRTGFIDYNQYKTGMMTLGVKSFNPDPPMTIDGMITKLYFVEECYECLKDLLNDMIRKRPQDKRKSVKIPRAPPPSLAAKSMQCISDTAFPQV